MMLEALPTTPHDVDNDFAGLHIHSMAADEIRRRILVVGTSRGTEVLAHQISEAFRVFPLTFFPVSCRQLQWCILHQPDPT